MVFFLQGGRRVLELGVDGMKKKKWHTVSHVRADGKVDECCYATSQKRESTAIRIELESRRQARLKNGEDVVE